MGEMGHYFNLNCKMRSRCINYQSLRMVVLVSCYIRLCGGPLGKNFRARVIIFFSFNFCLSAVVLFWNYPPEYLINRTPLGSVTITKAKKSLENSKMVIGYL